MSPEFLVAVAWKATLVLAVASLTAFVFRRAPAALRHLVWVLALVSLLILPALYRWAPAWNVSGGHAVQLIAVADPAVAQAPAVTPDRQFPWLAAVWLAGALVAGTRLAASLLRSRSAERADAGPVASGLCRHIAREIGLRRVPRLATSAQVSVPWTRGVFRPCILLPAGALDWPLERLRVVLLHESIHILRCDWFSQIVMECVCALYWFHPLAWLAALEARKAGEQACDDAVLRHGTPGTDYAGHLLAVARAVRGTGYRPAVVAMAVRSSLEQRLRALLDGSRSRRGVRRAEAMTAIAACLLVLAPLAVIRAQTRTTGSLAGTVYDASGAVIPNAGVTAAGLETQNKEVTHADAAGDFVFDSIPSGRYSLEVRVPGFKVYQRNVTVQPNQRVTTSATLEIGSVNETMNIVAKGSRAPVPAATAATPQRIRVGGNVQATRMVKMVRPTYPDRARQSGIEGTVLLQAVISTDGTLLNLAPLNTLADPDLVKAAVDAVSQWRYQPTLLNGAPVEVVTTITLNFKLE